MVKQALLFPIKTGLALFWLGWWMVALGLLAWYPMRWWPGDSFLPVQVLNYFMPWLLLLLLPGLIFALLARRAKLAVGLAIPTLLVGLSYIPLFMPRTTVALAENTSLKVMSFNVNRWNSNVDQLFEVISREKPDVLLLQEARYATLNSIKTDLTHVYGSQSYTAFVPDMQQAVVSRYPITPIDNAFHEGRVQKVRINTPGGPVQVWNVHASRPVLWPRHYQQLTALAESAKIIEAPLIVAGDFNTTDQSELYRKMNGVLQNAHWEAGWGFGFSFPANQHKVKGLVSVPALVRIDHIFYNDHLFASDARTLQHAAGSDHRPVIATLSLTGEQ